jgi:hypothetical protein
VFRDGYHDCRTYNNKTGVFHSWDCASLASTRTLMAHGADTHLVRFRF